MVIRTFKCPGCGRAMLAGGKCSHCPAGGAHLRQKSASGLYGPLITFVFVFVGLWAAAEVLLAEKGLLAPVLLIVGSSFVMRFWQIGYWHEDGEPILRYLGASALLGDFLGAIATPGRIIWFWKTDRPYFRACLSATVLASTIFCIVHAALLTASRGS